MSTVNVEHVRNSLKKCMDPEVPLSIVDMGLIYGIDVTENNDVKINMAMGKNVQNYLTIMTL